jgi:sugar phosphate isomerase/epimerase
MEGSFSWSICGFDVVDQSQETIIEMCRVAGFSGIEGAPPLFGSLSDGELAAAGVAFRDAGIATETFHLPFGKGDDIADFYESDRRQAVAGQRRWMERAAAFGADVVIQHPTVNSNDCRIEGVDTYLSRLDRSLTELLPAAADLGVTIAIENMAHPSNQRFASMPDHFRRVVAELVPQGIGFCFDTGHALISPGIDLYDEYLDLIAPHVACFHLADNGGNRDSHLPPGHGNVPWEMVFRKASQIGFTRCMCIETPPFASVPYTLESWKAMVHDTGQLAAAALGTAGDE